MSYYWAMAGQWMASTLRSTAEAHLARAAAIRTGAQSIGALRPPVWTGRAAQTERADREAMTARMDRTTQVLEGYGRLARDTASELAAIQADRADHRQRAERVGVVDERLRGAVPAESDQFNRGN